MTPRAARLVAATAVLAWCAAALSFLAPALPPGLAVACAPDLVARELLAGLAVAALLVVPSFTADEPGRPREDHAGGLAALVGLPAVLALHLAGGGGAAALLPALALIAACDLAASSWLRLDPAGRRAPLFAGAAAALLAGLPVAAWGAAELGGWEGAALGFRLSPLLAIRDLAGGWEGMAPALLTLVALAALLRLLSLRAGPGAAAAAGLLILCAGTPAAAAAEEGEAAPVLVVGGPREGPVADLAAALRGGGLGSVERDALPSPLPWETEVVLLGRPRGPVEAGEWLEGLRPFLRAGGRAAALPGSGAEALAASATVGDLGAAVVLGDGGAVAAAAELLGRKRTVLPHPAAGREPGVAPALFRLPFPPAPRSLPGRVLAFLALLAAGSASIALAARRRGLGQGRTGAALGGLAFVGSALLFLPGLAAGEVATARLALEERSGFEAATARRVELLRVERTAAGEGRAAVEPGAGAWTELRYEAAAEPRWTPGAGLLLEGPGRWGLLGCVSGVGTPPPAGPFLAVLRVREGRAWELPGAALRGRPAGEGPGVPLEAALAAWRRSEEPRLSRAGWLLAACLRADGESLTLAVPAVGVDAVVFRE